MLILEPLLSAEITLAAPQELGAHMRAEIEKLQKAVKATGLRRD